MNTNAILSGAAAAVLLFANGSALADDYAPRGAVYDYARVLSVTPNVRYVTVRAPVRECWEETRHYTVDRNPHRDVAGTIVGAVLGGVIGHQFGSGRGNDAATVAGALAGAAIGSDSGPRVQETYSRPVQRCETRYTTHQEERVDGYHVIYTYNGQKYATDTPFDPGKRLRIRVDVRPAPY